MYIVVNIYMYNIMYRDVIYVYMYAYRDGGNSCGGARAERLLRDDATRTAAVFHRFGVRRSAVVDPLRAEV